jgi:hypothetical protein
MHDLLTSSCTLMSSQEPSTTTPPPTVTEPRSDAGELRRPLPFPRCSARWPSCRCPAHAPIFLENLGEDNIAIWASVPRRRPRHGGGRARAPERWSAPRVVLAARWRRAHGPAQLQPGREAGLAWPVLAGPGQAAKAERAGPPLGFGPVAAGFK